MTGDDRGVTPYAELSAGERWRIALDVAVGALPSHGVLTVPQEAWEGLDPENRRLVAEHVRDRGVVLLTAEASEDDEVTASVFE